MRTNKQKFVRLIVKTWKESKLGFITHKLSNPERTRFCALGAAAIALDPDLVLETYFLEWSNMGLDVEKALLDITGDYAVRDKIINASNSAHTKTEAIRNIKNLPEW